MMMNPLFNPLMSMSLLKNYLMDPGRIQRLNTEQMKRYRDKAFRNIVKYAYTVPLYHDKYKKAGIHPSDIRTLDDIIKLPFITKNDLRENFPDRIMPVGYDKRNGFVVSTGGTSGKPVSLYTDFFTMSKGSFVTIRQMKIFNLKWNKAKFVHIGNFNTSRVDLVYDENFMSHIKSIISINDLNLDVNMPTIDMINRLDDFRPDVIMSYPNVFQHLAFLKRKGYGKNIKPKLLWVGGSILDKYTRSYVEDAFGCKLLNIYPSVEAEADIAFECMEGAWHINYDFFNLEAIDENFELVPSGERGHVVLTRLWGRGTPIIRYTGMDDLVKLNPLKKCCCGLVTPVIDGGVEGRKGANIVLPSGKVFPSGAFCFIESVLHNLKTFKVKQYQVIQKKIDEIDILIVIDNDLRNVGPSVDELFRSIKEIYEQKAGPGVIINVIEVDEIKGEPNSRKPPPVVVSNVTIEQGYKVFDGV